MFKSLRTRLGLLFFAFALIVLISSAATVWGLETQRQDALLINLAGRQRMLIQQMARLAFMTEAGQDSASVALQQAEEAFDATLQALRFGGQAPYLPGEDVELHPTNDTDILSMLDEVALTWQDYRTNLIHLKSLSPDDPIFRTALQSVQTTTPMLTQQADAVVRRYEARAIRNLNRLRLMQAAFLVGALLLLGAGAWVTRKSVLAPLTSLSQAAWRIGKNDLDSPVQVAGPTEFQVLSNSFDDMRVNLQTYRRELLLLNENLEERVRRRTEELEALNEISKEVNAQLELQRVLELVSEKARVLLGGEVASLCLVDDSSKWLALQAISGPQEAFNPQVRPEEDGRLPGMIIESEQLLKCGTEKCRGICQILSPKYRASHLAVPLQVADRVIGALCVGFPSDSYFSDESRTLLQRLANIAAIALENARLYQQAERVATLEERRRVAAKMHDGLGQTLSYLGLITDKAVSLVSEGRQSDALEHLRQARETMQKATGEVRNAIDNLMNDTPITVDLEVRLRQFVDEFSQQNNLPITWLSDSGFVIDCPRQVSEQVFNIAREALQNAAHHARAKKIKIQAGETSGHYFLSVQDNGLGFDASQPPPRGHFGLQIMRARALVIGGQVEVESTPGEGTQVTLIWPSQEKRRRLP